MSGPAGAGPPAAVLGLGLELCGPWPQRDARRSGASARTRRLAGSVHPPPSAGGRGEAKAPLRLPSLVGPRRRSGMARLSLSEPSLLTPNANILFEGFSSNRRPSVLQKRPPPPPPFSKSSVLVPCKTSGTGQPHQQQNHQQVQSFGRLTYIHFSHAIQPSSKPRPVRRHSHNPALSAEMVQGDPRPSVMQHRNSLSQGELLSVVEAEGEEVDSESVDEGFMDELDSKMISLKLQQGAPKTVT